MRIKARQRADSHYVNACLRNAKQVVKTIFWPLLALHRAGNAVRRQAETFGYRLGWLLCGYRKPQR